MNARRTLTTAALLLAATACGAPGGADSPPDGPWPKTGVLEVTLCRDSTAVGCDRDERDADWAAIEAKVRAIPGIRDVHLKPREQSRAEAAVSPRSLEADKLVGTLDTVTSGRELERTLSDLPGVGMALVFHQHFWSAKADVSVLLCHRGGLLDSLLPTCEHPPTGEDREAVVRALLPRAERVYYEDREHNARVWNHYLREQGTPGQEMLHVKGLTVEQARAALKGVPGVGGVISTRLYG
ncbi:hypothetical protein ACIBG7_13955 [Nonomuraea sp. NPDC050328]|uniref:hypothetical protein n=1 Tax=Nonomuraea sp. NPDC050328 TaxID=3364361 RepID=UPI0037926566